jgi:hypothetical protein
MTTNGDQGLLTAVDTQNIPLQIQHTLVTDGDPTPTEVELPTELPERA